MLSIGFVNTIFRLADDGYCLCPVSFTVNLMSDLSCLSVNHIKCPLCDMTCTSLATLKIHIKFRHCDERPFPCDFCESRLLSHIDSSDSPQLADPYGLYILCTYYFAYSVVYDVCLPALRTSMTCGSTWRPIMRGRPTTAL